MFRVGIVDRTGVNWKAFKLFVCSGISALNIAPRKQNPIIVARPAIILLR